LSDGSADNIDIHQAYIKLDQVFAQPISITVGRQEIVFGGQRLVGSVGWHNFGRSFDAVKVRLGKPAYVDLFNAQLVNGAHDRYFFGFYGHIPVENRASLGLYGLFEVDDSPGAAELKRRTLGVYSKGRFAPTTAGLSYEFESAFQRGTRGLENVDAYMITGALSGLSQ
jgi:hypothetical protein